MRKMGIERLIQKVWTNFGKEDGPCSRCSIRDENLFWYPEFAGGSLQAEVAVVAISPNAPKRREILGNSNPRFLRTDWKRMREDYWSDIQENRRYPISKALRGMLRDSGLSLTDIYFTNLRKCPGALNRPDESEEAKDICGEYLEEELIGLRPRMIVTLGESPTRRVLEIFSKQSHWDDYGRITTIHSRDVDAVTPFRCAILPFTHWNRGNYNLGMTRDKKRSYYESLRVNFNRVYAKINDIGKRR